MESSEDILGLLPEDAAVIALDVYLHGMGGVLSALLGNTARTLLINVDSIVVSSTTASAIGLVVYEIVRALKPEVGKGIIQVACGMNPDGGLTLQITDEWGGETTTSRRDVTPLGATAITVLVSHLDAHMAVDRAKAGLNCTIVIPADGR